MIYLLLSVICSVLIGFIFKMFYRHGIDAFQAIVFNYLVCLTCGTIHLGRFPVRESDLERSWLPYAVALGFVFISGFNGAALTVRYFGVTVSQIMQKSAILLTVPFAILVYNEPSDLWKVSGFLLALLSIVLVNLPSKGQAGAKVPGKAIRMLWIPFLTWVLAGVIEVLFIRVHKEQFIDVGDPSFISTVFGTAGLIRDNPGMRRTAGETACFFLAKCAGRCGARHTELWQYAVYVTRPGQWPGRFLVFPVANVGIIIVTTIGAVQYVSGATFNGQLAGHRTGCCGHFFNFILMEKDPVRQDEAFLFHPQYVMLSILLFGLSALFLALTASYVYTRVTMDVPPVRVPVLFIFNTLVLLGSSYTMVRARRCYLNDDTRGYQTNLKYTILALGIIYAVAGCCMVVAVSPEYRIEQFYHDGLPVPDLFCTPGPRDCGSAVSDAVLPCSEAAHGRPGDGAGIFFRSGKTTRPAPAYRLLAFSRRALDLSRLVFGDQLPDLKCFKKKENPLLHSESGFFH